MKRNPNQYRQGDVLIERVENIPTDAKAKRQIGRPVLAHGEVTGHCHEIEDRTAKVFDSENNLGGDQRGVSIKFADLQSDTALVHQEHAPIPLKKGVYRITRQREYSPEAIRQVAD